jgi:hypothetical protein
VHLDEQRCTLLTYAAPDELGWSLLTNAAPNSATLRPAELGFGCTLLSYAALSELQYATPYTELLCILASYAVAKKILRYLVFFNFYIKYFWKQFQ